MQLDRICEPRTKDYYKEPEVIAPANQVSFTIEPREKFWKEEALNIVFEIDVEPKKEPKETKFFDFETEILKFRGGKSRDLQARKRKRYVS